MNINFDLAKDKDETVELIFSNGEYFNICSDCDRDCIGIKNKTVCWLYAPEKGICPFLINEP